VIESVGYDDHCFCCSWIRSCVVHWIGDVPIGRSMGCLHGAPHSDFGSAPSIWI
jgi:hypothetical protein